MAITSFINENIATYITDHIGVYDSSGNKVGKIALDGLKPAYDEIKKPRIYRFGLLSDVHRQSSQASENAEDMQRAFAFFNQKESVEFTVICGDISQNGSSEFSLYKNSVDTYSPDTEVYTTTGNHDATSSGLNLTSWNQYTGNHGRVFEITKHNDHFLFLGMDRWQFSSTGYTTSDMDWLASKLEEYKNERCFVITHMFFPDYAGNFKQIYPSGNWLSGSLLSRLQPLVDGYPNTIWFSGHSHWKWELQRFESKANIFRPANGGWTVHVPSCASPIDSDGVSTREERPLESQGAIVDVYADFIEVRGIDLKTGKYLPIAQYRLDTTLTDLDSGSTTPPEETPDDLEEGYAYVTPENFFPVVTKAVHNTTEMKPSSTWDPETHTLALTFKDVSQKFVSDIPDEYTGAHVKFDEVSFDQELSTNALTAFGFYSSTTIDGSNYTILNDHTYAKDTVSDMFNPEDNGGKTTLNGVQFNTSSKFTSRGGTCPITVTFKRLRWKLIE